MRILLVLLLAALPMRAMAAEPQTFVLPGPLGAETIDRMIPELAEQVIAGHHDGDRQRHLGTLFRLQMAAGKNAEAIASIRSLRALRDDPPAQPPLYLQYEIHAAARAQSPRGRAYAEHWNAAFAAHFGRLDSRVALQAEYSFGGDLPRMQADLDKVIAALSGRSELTLEEAVELIRVWQVHSAYAAFQPLFAPALRRNDARRYRVDRDAIVRTPDGVGLAVLVVRPAVETPLPALLTYTIYANDDWAWADAKKAAAYGYAGVVAYSRGKGRSTDAIVPFEHDGEDAAAVVDWIATQPWNDGRVGMYGGSYSGYTQWAALKHRPKALKAIATSATAAPGIDVPMEGGVFLNFMYPWPFYVAGNRSLDDATYQDSARWAALDRNAYASGRAYRELPAIDGQPNPVFSRWLQHPAYDEYWQRMIPQGEAFAAIDVPVLVTTGYFDGAQVGALHYFREHLRHRPNADHTLLIGPFEHFSMQTGVPPVVQGYTTDPVARVDLQALRLDWFDHVFKGLPKPALLAERVNWQVMGANTWRHARSLDDMAPQRMRACLSPDMADGMYRLSDRAQPDAGITQTIDFTDRTDVERAPSNSVVHAMLDPHAGLVFATAPFEQDTEIAGGFSGTLDFTINKRDADIALAVYELNPAGEYLDLGWWLQRASYNADRRHRTLLEPGASQRLRIDDTRLIGRRFIKGSRLVITLGIVKQPDRQLNLGSGKEPAEETLADAGESMRIRWQGSSCLEFGLR